MTTGNEFISEDDLRTFEGWLRYHAVDVAALTPEELATWKRMYKEAEETRATTPKVGLMTLRPIPGEYRYAVALQEDDHLWLTLWVRRSSKGEFFVLQPMKDRDWDPHTSYHLDGTLHMKSFDRRALPAQKRQPLTGVFRGSECLGGYGGHAPKSVGAVCDPTAFSGVVEVAPGVLGPRHGVVTVDLVEPGHEPTPFPWKDIVVQQVFKDITPWVVFTVGSQQP